MNQGLSVAVLIVGIVLIAFGFNAYHSASSQVSQVMTGTPTTKAMCLLIAGLIVAITGALGVSRR